MIEFVLKIGAQAKNATYIEIQLTKMRHILQNYCMYLFDPGLLQIPSQRVNKERN